MRSNGLTADDYAPLAEVERSVAADALLALREAGVAAYVVLPQAGITWPGPAATGSRDAGDAVDAVAGEAGQPHRATVFVDRTALHRARAVVRALAADAGPAAGQAAPVDEEAWEQIVTGFASTADEPDRGPLDGGHHAPPPRDPGVAAPPTTPPPTQPHPLVRDDDEHFVPEPPPPPPVLDWVGRLAWTGVLGSPLLMLAAALISWTPPRALVLLCVIGFVGGMVTLILRMKDRPPNDSGPDNGAVV